MTLLCSLFRRAFLGSMLLGFASPVSGETFTDLQAFLTANPGLTLFNFEGIAPPQDTIQLPQPIQGVTFQGEHDDNRNFDPRLIGVTDATPSDYILVNTTQGYRMRILFDRLYAKVGLMVKIGSGNVTARVQAYSNGTVVGDQTLITAADFSTFIGFTEALGIDRIDISAPQERGNAVRVDDLRFGTEVADTSDVPIPMEWKTVGNPGNRPDLIGFGRVDYKYRITKHEITNTQYVEFLNAVAASDPNGLFNLATVSDPRAGIIRSGTPGSYTYSTRKNMANKPVIWVSFNDAARMANWMHNGKGSGGTENGVYDMSVETPIRQAGAKYFIPSEDEWYKAAAYDPTPGAGAGDNYWLYATRAENAPMPATTNGSGMISNPGVNVANYESGARWGGLAGHLTTVGSAGAQSESYYGTADQSGNVSEWNDTVFSAARRGIRGGGWNVGSPFVTTSRQDYNIPTVENPTLGFRLAAPVPVVSASIVGPASLQEDLAGQLQIRVARTGDSGAALEVNFTSSGSATAGEDYLLGGAEGTKVTIPAGAEEAIVTIDPVADNLDEADESITFTLSAGGAYDLAAGKEVTATIIDDDFSPVALDDSGYEVPEDGSLDISSAAGVLANDTDEDDGNGPDHLVAELVSNVSHGELFLRPDGSFLYAPLPDYFGPDSFTYRANDGTNRSGIATVSLTVSERVDLHLSAASSLPVVGAPGTVTHTFTLENRGPSDATSVTVELGSALPPGVTANPAVPGTGTFSGNRWQLDLAEGSTASLSVTYAVSPGAPGGTANLGTNANVVSTDQPRIAPGDDSASVTSGIVSPAGTGVAKLDIAPLIDKQQGLFIQKLTVTNNNTLALAGFRLLVGNLPADVQVYNRQGLDPQGLPYVDWSGALAPGAQVTLTIEFFHPGRNPSFAPTYTISSVLAVAPTEPAVADGGSGPTRVVVLENRDMLLEFNSVPGSAYAIEYTHDGTLWHRAEPSVTASSNRTQWIDSGPPKTSAHPSTEPVRYYRIVTLPE
ncbi:SUMF1/EgtB/PvdO family nonheme iron enzyme [Luteolibacter luteus]|uniref:SUMF1/EgtB/PvdO family nonheme iron enzyme n=1 Tax=Luteolibacter luteus TaxID=2728835 RepID=A0A858RJW4_9BACT|nr:SUMF1/EgtB/PvdO family nonheme iron enzyme [Luteolibacter luteus]QJE96861.1 SUMF1/EgtB/PvdO family nonheme iron enzyme [Luteolibacter luteus]